MGGAVIVVDADFKILVWNDGAFDLWGLREDELRGKNIFGLDIGLATRRLEEPIRACLSGGSTAATLSIAAVNGRSEPFTPRARRGKGGTNDRRR